MIGGSRVRRCGAIIAAMTAILSRVDAAALATASIQSPVELVHYLRAGDERLVRPSPSATTAARQRESAVQELLPAVLQDIVDTNTTAVCDCDDLAEQASHATAAEAVHLLTTDNPETRAHIGTVPDVLASLVSLVGESVSCNSTAASPSWRAAEEAAEALWILAFNSRANHGALLEAGAPEVLALPLLAAHAPSRAKMWAAAALQNMAASYCATRDGRCSWRRDGRQLTVQEALVVDAEVARQRIGAVPGLVQALAALAGETPPRGRVLPSVATRSDRLAPGIAAWAAAGALKNLALSTSIRPQIMASGAAVALCSLASSPCWLESSKSQAALQHVGIDDCADLHRRRHTRKHVELCERHAPRLD